MTKIRYADQSVDNLQLLVANQAIEKPVCILDTGTFANGGVRGEVHIIGSSHCATFYHGDQVLTELLTCEPPNSFSPLWRSLTETPTIVESFGELNYRFVPRICSLEQTPTPPTAQSICSLRFQFPRTENGETPLTLVDITPIADGVKVHTVHQYPNEGKAALTTSIIRGG